MCRITLFIQHSRQLTVQSYVYVYSNTKGFGIRTKKSYESGLSTNLHFKMHLKLTSKSLQNLILPLSVFLTCSSTFYLSFNAVYLSFQTFLSLFPPFPTPFSVCFSLLLRKLAINWNYIHFLIIYSTFLIQFWNYYF